MDLANCLAVALGGALGTLGRYGLAIALAPVSQSLPVGTIVINVIGSFVIGFFGTLTLAQGRMPVPEQVRLFVMVGLCGGFTTFSSFSLQTLDLLRGGSLLRAAANVTLSVVLCLAAVALGHAVAAHYNGGAVAVTQSGIEEDA